MKVTTFACLDLNNKENKIKELNLPEFKPTLAFAFSSVRIGIPDLVKNLGSLGVSIFGASSCGEVLSTDDKQSLYEESFVVAFTDISKNSFKQKLFRQEENKSFKLGQDIGQWGATVFKNPVFLVVVSGLATNGQKLVEGVINKAGNSTVMFGGLAGDDHMFENTYVFSHDEIIDNGANVVVLDGDKIEVNGLATSGWIELGKDLKVTSAEGNIVYSIDNEPALDVYKRYLDVNDDDLPGIGVEYPLMIKRDNDTTAMRAVLGVDKEKKSLIFAGTVPKGSTVTFSSSPGFEVIETTIKKVEEFYNKHSEADLLLLFSCMARYKALGPTITEEIQYPSKKWGVPLIGFFTYGEIGTNENVPCDFYNQTYTLVAIKETK